MSNYVKFSPINTPIPLITVILATLLLIFLPKQHATIGLVILMITTIGWGLYWSLYENDGRMLLWMVNRTQLRIVKFSDVDGDIWYRIERRIKLPFGWHVWAQVHDYVYGSEQEAVHRYEEYKGSLDRQKKDLRKTYGRKRVRSVVRSSGIRHRGKEWFEE